MSMSADANRTELLDQAAGVVSTVLEMGFTRPDMAGMAAARELDRAGLLSGPAGDVTADLLEMLTDFARSRGIAVPDGFAATNFEDYYGTITLTQRSGDGLISSDVRVYIPSIRLIALAEFAMTWKRH